MKNINHMLSQKETEQQAMNDLCRKVKDYVRERDYESCQFLIPRFMELYPDSAIPHNLMGIVMESQGRHPEAMKHFRAAWALDSTFTPANRNMDAYSLYDRKKEVEPAYTMEDCLPPADQRLMGKTAFFLRSLVRGVRKMAA